MSLFPIPPHASSSSVAMSDEAGGSYLQKLWLPRPCSKASDLHAVLTLCLTAGESHGRQREPLFVSDAVPRYDWPEPFAHSWFLSNPQNAPRNQVLKTIQFVWLASFLLLLVKLYLLDIWAWNTTASRSECFYRCNTKDCCRCQGSWDGEKRHGQWASVLTVHIDQMKWNGMS